MAAQASLAARSTGQYWFEVIGCYRACEEWYGCLQLSVHTFPATVALDPGMQCDVLSRLAISPLF